MKGYLICYPSYSISNKNYYLDTFHTTWHIWHNLQRSQLQKFNQYINIYISLFYTYNKCFDTHCPFGE